MTTIEACVPVLLNFRENGLVYSAGELSRLETQVLSRRNGITTGTRASDFRYELAAECLCETLVSVGADEEVAKQILRVEVYYYHHRIILKYVFKKISRRKAKRSYLTQAWQRRARELILTHSRHVLITKFVAAINTAGLEGGPVPDEHGRVTSYYSYCLLLLPLHRSFEQNIENFLGSHTFRIVEVTPKLLERDRVHIVRISIPSINLYSRGAMKDPFKVDILNAVYQHMLYAKKEEDASSLHDITAFTRDELDSRNVMQEAQLHALWNHAVDALGGRMVDLQGVHQQTLLFRTSILALVLALAGILITVGLALR